MDSVQLITSTPSSSDTSTPAAPPADPANGGVQVSTNGGMMSATADTTAPVPKVEEPAKKEEVAKAADRPSWLPEEFKTPEEMAEAYKKTKAAPAATTTPPAADTKVLEEAGVDMAQLGQEYAKDGKLSDASLKKLEKAGIKQAQVSEYIEGQKARQELYVQKLQDSVGGKEELQATLKWADTNLTEAEKVAANKALQSLDAEQAKMVLQGLHSRRVKTEGSEPSLVRGRSAGVSDAPKGYESTAQWQKDVRSKEYKSDPAFRAKVMAKLGVSKI